MTSLIFRSYDDWGTLLKRVVLFVPFIVLVESSLYIFINPAHFIYWYSGVLLSGALLLNVPNVWPHYLTTLTVAVASILIPLVRKQLGDSFGFCNLFVIFFCAAYLIILNRKQVNYASVLIKSAISGMLVVLFVWIFWISDSFIDRHNISFGIAFGFLCLLGLVFLLVFYNLGKNYFKANDLFKKGKITKPLEDLLAKRAKKTKQAGVCDCCGKINIPQELLFNVGSDQQLCANCRKKMEDN